MLYEPKNAFSENQSNSYCEDFQLLFVKYEKNREDIELDCERILQNILINLSTRIEPNKV
jgi:hypothetical protein